MGLNGRVGTGAEAGGQLVLVWGGVRGLLQLRPGLELGELLVLGLTKGLGSPCAEGVLKIDTSGENDQTEIHNIKFTDKTLWARFIFVGGIEI